MVEILRDFESEYHVDQIWETTGSQSEMRKLFYPGASELGGKDGLLIRVVPSAGEPWIGSFAPGPRSHESKSQVMSCPNPNELCVVSSGAGYIVRADDPSNWTSVRAIPVCDARSIPGDRLLVLSDFTKFVAYGENGLQWESPSVSSDGIEIVNIANGRLDLIAWDAAEQKRARITLNLENGSIISRSLDP